MNRYLRILLTVIELFVTGFLVSYVSNKGTVITGGIAAQQFDNRDMSAVLAAMNTISYAPAILGVALVALLVLTWWGPLKKMFSTIDDRTTGGSK
jgi:hypothetical protein